MSSTTVYIVYDSITNPVFESQVIIPLQKRSFDKNNIIISFEYNPTKMSLTKLQEQYPNITFILLKKYRYWCRLSLLPSLWALRAVLRDLDNYEIITRGLFATYITLKAIDNLEEIRQFIVQVRGLIAAEYEYSCSLNRKSVFSFLNNMRSYQFLRLEQKVLQSIPKNSNFVIEVVSKALGDYLKNIFFVPAQQIVSAKHDTPPPISEEQKIVTRRQIRFLYNIPEDAYVYCYNGSAKPWQCPTETVIFFKEQRIKNPNAFLMIISNDIHAFRLLLNHYAIPSQAVVLIHIPHSEVIQHLAACDAGIIFREPHLMNWISRPTKALEYQAAGLSIIHNNTVDFLRTLTYSPPFGDEER